MKIKDIDFPETLLDTQTEGTLVFLAGAGVSYVPPAGLPNFEGGINNYTGNFYLS